MTDRWPKTLLVLPDGFHKVSVLLTEAEFTALRGEACLTGEGTYSAALRRRLGLSDTPYGLRAAVKRMEAAGD